MIRKFVSLVTLIVATDMLVQSRFQYNEPIFVFTSSNLAVNLITLLLVVLTVLICFKSKFKTWLAYAACAGLAVLTLFVGWLGFWFSNVGYWFQGTLLPFNYMMILECGVCLGLCALSYKHGRRPANLKLYLMDAWASWAGRLPRLHLPRPTTYHSAH